MPQFDERTYIHNLETQLKAQKAKLDAAEKLAEAAWTTLAALEVFKNTVAAKDMIVPLWTNNCIDELDTALSAFENA